MHSHFSLFRVCLPDCKICLTLIQTTKTLTFLENTFFFCLSSVSVFSCAGCIWTWMMLHYTVNWGVLRMSRLTLGRMSSVWGGWRTKSCKMYVMLFLTETSVSFTPNSVVKNCFSLSDRNVSFAVSAIHLDGHWTWKYEIRWYFGWKQPIFTMISLQINCYLLSETLHSALFIPHYCQTNGHSSLCSTEWFMLKTIH